MMLVTSLILMQAAPMPARPISPWTDEVQTMVCTLLDQGAEKQEYVLTLTDSLAFIVGQEPGQALSMAVFEPFKARPSVVRGQATIRRLEFGVGSETAFVRQLYQGSELVSTFLMVGSNATEQHELPFEKYAGFCSLTEPANSETAQ